MKRDRIRVEIILQPIFRGKPVVFVVAVESNEECELKKAYSLLGALGTDSERLASSQKIEPFKSRDSLVSDVPRISPPA